MAESDGGQNRRHFRYNYLPPCGFVYCRLRLDVHQATAFDAARPLGLQLRLLEVAEASRDHGLKQQTRTANTKHFDQQREVTT